MTPLPEKEHDPDDVVSDWDDFDPADERRDDDDSMETHYGYI